MRRYIINNCLKLIKNNNNGCDEKKLSEIKYGLETIYILVTKTIFIIILAYFLNLLTELIIFIIIYQIIKMPSFGLHATKSWMCILSSSIIFIITPYICKTVDIPLIIKVIVGFMSIVLIYKNAPADTYKRPIISKRRRNIYKFISTIIAIIFVIMSLLISQKFLSNSLIMALVIQCFLTSPLIYKLFKLPYNNYLAYGHINKV